MITLNELMRIVDARRLRVIVPVTPRLKAHVSVDTQNVAEWDDMLRLYGEHPVFGAEPAQGEAGVMEIELLRPQRERGSLALAAGGK